MIEVSGGWQMIRKAVFYVVWKRMLRFVPFNLIGRSSGISRYQTGCITGSLANQHGVSRTTFKLQVSTQSFLTELPTRVLHTVYG